MRFAAFALVAAAALAAAERADVFEAAERADAFEAAAEDSSVDAPSRDFSTTEASSRDGRSTSSKLLAAPGGRGLLQLGRDRASRLAAVTAGKGCWWEGDGWADVTKCCDCASAGCTANWLEKCCAWRVFFWKKQCCTCTNTMPFGP
ncbi:hypothetical protein M885DRAFT_613720 [Pelagophyceae sp. CCMP2097]|nr:hypothetical protein M885DRAFT_613720 [Pelagophyceae sp. CCMP2097]